MELHPFSSHDAKCKTCYHTLFQDSPYKLELFDWLFDHRLEGYDKTKQSLLLMQNQKCIGFNGVVPFRAWCDGQEQLAYWSCDFILTPDVRGKGLGREAKRLLKQQLEGHFILSSGISKLALPVLLKEGWRLGNSSFKAIYNPKHRFNYLFRLFTFVHSCFLLLSNSALRAAFFVKSKSDYSVVERQQFATPEQINGLWHKVKKSYGYVVCRDHEYLNWKYQNHPLASDNYQYLELFQNKTLRALLIIRLTKRSVQVVDYVGERHNVAVKLALLQACKKRYQDLAIALSSNDAEFAQCATLIGLRKLRSESKFVYLKQDDNSSAPSDWFLMAGDSDGELLAAASDAWKGNHGISMQRLSVNDFEHMQPQWTDLLGRSAANPVFMSWQWQFTWWQTWGEQFADELVLVAFYQQQKLVGILPLYMEGRGTLKTFSIKRLHFIGNCYKTKETVRSEYLEPIVDKTVCHGVYKQMLRFLRHEVNWQEFIFNDFVRDKYNSYFVDELIKQTGKSLLWSTDTGMKIMTDASEASYLSGLGRNTRKKYFNDWQKFANHGGVLRDNVSDAEQFMTHLNNFHQTRWGKAVFSGDSLSFHQNLLKRLDDSRVLQKNLSYLELNNEVVSCSYNISATKDEVNIQSGFIEKAPINGLSMGKLHLGQLIKNAFSDDRKNSFDLLAGVGKHSDYKQHLKGRQIVFQTFSIVSSRYYLSFQLVRLYRKANNWLEKLTLAKRLNKKS